MKKRIGMRALSVLLAVLLVSVAFVPAVSAQSEKRFEEEMLQNAGIKVNSIDTKLVDYKRIADTTVFSGHVIFDAESEINGKTKQIIADQNVNGYFCDDGSYHIESVGSSYRSVTDAQVVSESSDAITLRIEQVAVVNGVAKTSSDTVTLPKNKNSETSDLIGMNNIDITRAKTMIDLPSMAPSGSTLMFNDVRYIDIMWGFAVLAVIAAFFGVVPGVIVGLAAVALQAIPDYSNVDPGDVYLDIWWAPLMPNDIWVEVDYYYI